jgi:Carboxypeptidase regulatory-like domain
MLRWSRLARTALLALLVAPGLVAAAGAQGESAAAVGTVSDPQGRPVPEVAVVARNADTGLTRHTSTAGDGRYWLAGLPPGRYELEAAKAGFRTVVRAGITLGLGASAVLDVELPLANIGETITVTADAPVVATTTSAVEMRLNRQQLDLLPLFGRDYLSLLRLTAAAQAFGSSFTGSRDRSNEFTLDGVDNTSDITGFQRTGVALDGIQEVQVLANNYKAAPRAASSTWCRARARTGRAAARSWPSATTRSTRRARMRTGGCPNPPTAC